MIFRFVRLSGKLNFPPSLLNIYNSSYLCLLIHVFFYRCVCILQIYKNLEKNVTSLPIISGKHFSSIVISMCPMVFSFLFKK